MNSLDIAKAVAREALSIIAKKNAIIKAQRWAIVLLAIALCIALMGWFICVSKM